MKFRDLIEDATAGATASADIATVAYPLFVKGKTRREKRKNARAAVGQKYVAGPKGVGTGVYEGKFTNWVYNKGDKLTHGLLGPVTVEKTKGQHVYVKAHSDSKVYKVSAGSLKSATKEAHVLGNDSVIYRLDRENPMTDTEVLVLGGAGRYTLKGLRDKARREADQLAQDLKIEHGGAFRRSAENVKQLTNTLNTIVAAYNELKRIRSKGGRGSRGITDEDANFIRECMGLVQRALSEGVIVEPDPHGYEKTKLTSPQYAVVVDTPSDYDWYKIGNHWHDRMIDPHEFGQEDSDTVMVASGEADFNDMLAKLDRMGFTYKLIGGTHSQPEIHKGRN